VLATALVSVREADSDPVSQIGGKGQERGRFVPDERKKTKSNGPHACFQPKIAPPKVTNKTSLPSLD
jgi:hypothetical protein